MTEKINGFRADMDGLMALPTREQVQQVVDIALSIRQYPSLHVPRPQPFDENDLDYQASQTIGKQYVSVGLACVSMNYPTVLITTERQLPSGLSDTELFHVRSYEFEPKGWRRKRYVPVQALEEYVVVSPEPETYTERLPAIDRAADRLRTKKVKKLERRLGLDIFTREHWDFLWGIMQQFDPELAAQEASNGS